MRQTRTLGLTLVAVFTFAVVSTSAVSAHDFTSSVMGKLKVVSNTIQVFTGVTCTTDRIVTGEAKAGGQKTLKATVAYSGCEMFFGGFPLGKAAINNVEYAFSAEGEVNLENTVTIKAMGCTIVDSGPQNKLKTVKYKNETGGKLNFEVNVTGINYSSSGLVCGTQSGTTAIYEGNTLIEVGGGTISWS
jgi:hypothetical protein